MTFNKGTGQVEALTYAWILMNIFLASLLLSRHHRRHCPFVARLLSETGTSRVCLE